MQAIMLSIAALWSSSTYQNGDIGLKINLPTESMVSSTSKSPPFCMISSSNPSNIWHLRLERGINPNAKTVNELLNLPQGEDFSDHQVVIENRSMFAGAVEGWLHAIEQRGTENPIVIVRFAIPIDGDQFILATGRCLRSSWDINTETILNCMQSIRPLDPVKLVQDKLKGLENSTTILSSLNKDILKPLIGFQEWRRIQSNEEDLGYALVQVSTGNIEEVEIRDGQEELPKTGIIVTVRSRLLPNEATGVVIDSFGRYWVSWDGKESRWSNRVTRWLEKAKATESETGIRNRPEIGSPKSRIIVIQQDLTSDIIKPPFKGLAEDPWLPRAFVWVLGPLLASGDHDSTYIWMTYENSNEQQIIATRTDSLHADDNGNWTIETHVGEGEVTLWSTFNAQGSLLKQVQKDGAIVTGTTPETLRAIWEPKNLW